MAFLSRIVAAHGLAGSCFLQTDCLPLQVENRKRKIKEIKLLTKYLNAMKKIYFLFLFVLIASMSGLQAAEKWTLVTSEPESWEGDYLIVYEDKAFDGSLTKLDALNDYTTVTVSGNEITTDVCDFYFTIEQIDGGYSIKSASGYYIYQTSDSNGLQSSTSTTGSNAITFKSSDDIEIVSGGAHLRFNATSNQMRFRYYKSSTYTAQKPIQLYKKQTAPVTELTAPVITGVVNDGIYYGSATVSISYPELATSMVYTITKDGSAGEPVPVTSAVADLVIDEAGSYKIEAAALGDGDAMEEATPVEFTILEGAEYVYTVSGAMSGEAIIETTGADGVWTLSKNLTYGGRDNGNRGYQLGSSGKPMEEFTLTLDKKYENIVSVIVNAATGGSCTLSVSVGGNAFGEEVSLTNESADYEFTGNASGNVTLNFNASEKACYLKSITIISTKKESVVCATPEFSLAEGTYNETQTLTITSSEGSTIVYSINDGEIEEAASPATITLEAEATAVTYEIVAFATMDGAEESETVTKTYTIDPDAVMPQSLTVKISEVADENEWAVSAGNEGTQYKSFTKDDFEFTIDATDANSGKYYSNSDGESWRVYNGASLTISAPASVEITGIEFVTGKWNCSGANTGSLQGKVWTATEENTSSVTFSMDGTSEILEMHISYKAIPAGVEGVEAADAAIRTNADGVVVTADGAVAEVYNAAGQLVAAEAVNGERVIALPAGFYIVRVGDATAKVVVK